MNSIEKSLPTFGAATNCKSTTMRREFERLRRLVHAWVWVSKDNAGIGNERPE